MTCRPWIFNSKFGYQGKKEEISRYVLGLVAQTIEQMLDISYAEIASTDRIRS